MITDTAQVILDLRFRIAETANSLRLTANGPRSSIALSYIVGSSKNDALSDRDLRGQRCTNPPNRRVGAVSREL